jgi:hypothetical protein
MNVTMIRAKVKPEAVADLESATKAWFAAIDEAQPQGVRYASCRLADDPTTAVVLLAVDDGRENPLSSVPGFEEFQESLAGGLAGPPTPEPLTVVGSYNVF